MRMRTAAVLAVLALAGICRGACFERVLAWASVRDEASAKQYAEIGVTDIRVSGADGKAAAKKYGMRPYCGTFTPCGAHEQVLGAEAQAYFDRVNAIDLPNERRKEESDRRLKESGCRFGGEQEGVFGCCPYRFPCFISDGGRAKSKARLMKILEADPSAEGIYFDGIGYTNLRSCECEVCRDKLAEFLKRNALEATEANRNRFYRQELVSYVNDLVDYVREIRPGIRVAIHLWPTFAPDPLYGRDLKADYVEETVAWYFQWDDGKIDDYVRKVVGARRPEGSEGVPFLGFSATSGRALAYKSPERLERELEIILAAGGRTLSVCNGTDMIRPGYREVFRKFTGKGKTEGTR